MRAQGIDISHWQKDYNPNEKKHDFVFIRAAYGLSKDKKFDQHSASIENVPVRGAYQFLRSNQTWKSQADKMITMCGDGFDVLILDLERYGNQRSLSFVTGVKMWLDYVADKTGTPTMLYTNPATYQEYLIPYNQHWMNNYPLWVAQYPYYGWHDNLTNVYSGSWNPRLPAGHKDWLLWQFSADGNRKGNENGIPGWRADVDLNVFNGTKDDLLRYFNKASNPAPKEYTDEEKLDLLWDVHPELH